MPLNLEYEHQKKELERILRSIPILDIHDHTLVYKIIGEEREEKEEIDSYNVRDEFWSLFLKMLDIDLNHNVEYAVYVKNISSCEYEAEMKGVEVLLAEDYIRAMIESCIKSHNSYACYDVISMFFSVFSIDVFSDEVARDLGDYLSYAVGDADPLSQIFLYRALSLNGSMFQHSYVCSEIYRCRHSKTINVVAYCTPFSNYVFGSLNGKLDQFNDQIRQLVEAAKEKLMRSEGVDKYDLEAVKGIIHDEIEKANELMRKYGIIRVVLSLD